MREGRYAAIYRWNEMEGKKEGSVPLRESKIEAVLRNRQSDQVR